MQRRSLLAGFMLAPLACQSSAASVKEAAVRELVEKQAEAWNRHDAHAWAEVFTFDAEFVNILGMLFKGREQIEQRHAQLFTTIFSRSRVIVTTRRVRSLGATSALVETVHELRDYARLPPGIQATDADGALRTRMTYLMLLAESRWQVASAQNTAIAKL